MRLPDQETTDRIAAELTRLGLKALATRAATGEFSDYSSPHPAPQHVLVAELRRALAAKSVPDLQGIADMVNAVIEGTYDSTPEEAQAWVQQDGQPDLVRVLEDTDALNAVAKMVEATPDELREFLNNNRKATDG